MVDYKENTLENGLRIITVKRDTQTLNLNLGINAGSMQDFPNRKGLAHFIEHMLFTGTKNRTHSKITEELEFLAGDSNAYTDIKNTVYSVSALNTELEASIDILSDMVMNSVFDSSEIERERQVILSEYREGKEDMETVSFDLLYEKAYKEDPLKLNVIGTEESIKAISYEDLRIFYKRYYIPSNCIICVVSSFDHDEVLNLIKKYFISWKDISYKKEDNKLIKNQDGRYITRNESFDMSSIAICYSFLDFPQDLELALKILNNRFGDSDNSILFKEIRLKRGLSYDVYSDLDLTDNIKSIEIYCASSPENIKEVEEIIFKEINKILNAEDIFTEKTLTLMKKIQKTNIANLLDDPSNLSSYMLNNALEGKDLLNYKNVLSKLENLKLSDLYEAARLAFKNPTIHVLNPGE